MNLSKIEDIILTTAYQELKDMTGLSSDAIEGRCQRIASRVMDALRELEDQPISMPELRLWRVTDGHRYVDDKPRG